MDGQPPSFAPSPEQGTSLSCFSFCLTLTPAQPRAPILAQSLHFPEESGLPPTPFLSTPVSHPSTQPKTLLGTTISGQRPSRCPKARTQAACDLRLPPGSSRHPILPALPGSDTMR